jgi:hypothetical protein
VQKNMKRLLVSAVPFVGLFFTMTLISNWPTQGQDKNRDLDALHPKP